MHEAMHEAFAEHLVDELDMFHNVPKSVGHFFSNPAFAHKLFSSDYDMGDNGHVSGTPSLFSVQFQRIPVHNKGTTRADTEKRFSAQNLVFHGRICIFVRLKDRNWSPNWDDSPK